MLIPFDYLVNKYSLKLNGVLHIGANVGEEAEMYHKIGLKKQIWIEGNPDLMPRLQSNVSKYPGAAAYNFCIGDEEKDVVFHVSNNGSQSSSVLELGTHKIQHPEVHYTHDKTVRMHRVDQLGLDLTGCDFLNIDLQGAELMALKGMGDLLSQFNFAYLEVNRDYLYKDCALIGEVDLYMEANGFQRRETKWCGAWGDGAYIRVKS